MVVLMRIHSSIRWESVSNSYKRGVFLGFLQFLQLNNIQFSKNNDFEKIKPLKTEQRKNDCVGSVKILRKEVIQPHLPIRLPCYDFTPIIYPTLGGWLPKGLPHRLRVLQTLVV